MDEDFKLIIQAVLNSKDIGKKDIDKIQKILDQYQVNLTTKLSRDDLVSKVKKACDEASAKTGIDIKVNEKDIIKAIGQVEKAQAKLNAAQEKNTLAEQEKYYKRIIDNTKLIYALKEKMLTADKAETKELQRQIANAEKRNSRAYDSISDKGLKDANKGLQVEATERELKNRLAIKQARLEDKQTAQEQAAIESQVAEYNARELEYQRLRAQYLAEGQAQQAAYNAQIQAQADKIQSSMDGTGSKSYENQILSLTKRFQELGLSQQEAENAVSSLSRAQSDLNEAIKTEATSTAELERKNQAIVDADKQRTIALNEVTNALKRQALESGKAMTDQERLALASHWEKWMQSNTKAANVYGDEIKALIERLTQLDQTMLKTEGNQIKIDLSGIESEARNAGMMGLSVFDRLKKAIEKFGGWSLVTNGISQASQAFTKMYDNIRTLDDSLLELNKVSDLTADGLAKVTEEAYELGETVGKTGTQVIDAVTEFKRAGYDMASSMEMAEAALVMTNVAEGITDASDAAGTLISVLKGFSMSESSVRSIVDMINSTSNQSPIGFDELADGLERVAGTMSQSGTSIEETIGLLTAGYAQLRDIERVSTSLITLSARLRGVDEDGEAIEGLSAELQESFGAIGVAIEDADGNLRSIYAIAQDYAKVLPDLTSKQKQYYAELAAG